MTWHESTYNAPAVSGAAPAPPAPLPEHSVAAVINVSSSLDIRKCSAKEAVHSGELSDADTDMGVPVATSYGVCTNQQTSVQACAGRSRAALLAIAWGRSADMACWEKLTRRAAGSAAARRSPYEMAAAARNSAIGRGDGAQGCCSGGVPCGFRTRASAVQPWRGARGPAAELTLGPPRMELGCSMHVSFSWPTHTTVADVPRPEDCSDGP